jgi:hypothetical protein
VGFIEALEAAEGEREEFLLSELSKRVAKYTIGV